jgi:hypothetical protein
MKRIGCGVVLMGLLLVSNTFAADQNLDRKQIYELQEKCGKRCEDMFKKEYKFVNTTKDGQMMNSYQNHYNQKLNKCFILVTTTNYPSDKKTDVLVMKVLFDINENKEYGSVDKFRKQPVPSSCNVLNKICTSEQEWDLLVKPYMED